MAKGIFNPRRVRWLRPMVDGAMTVVLLLQMAPGKTGNAAHEVLGIAFAVLFVLHHALNWGWVGRLRGQRTPRSRCALASDVLLTVCVVGLAATGILMSRSALPMLAVPTAAHVVRPFHSLFAYAGLMTCAFHVGLHVRVLCAYAGRRGVVRLPWALVVLCMACGLWAFARLGVAGKLLGRPSFPDGMTPLWVQLVLHVVLCLPFLALGSMVDTLSQGGQRNEK